MCGHYASFLDYRIVSRETFMEKLLRKILIAAVIFFMPGAVAASAAETIKLGVAGGHRGDLASYGLPPPFQRPEWLLSSLVRWRLLPGNNLSGRSNANQ